jgi:hypothetical protein
MKIHEDTHAPSQRTVRILFAATGSAPGCYGLAP